MNLRLGRRLEEPEGYGQIADIHFLRNFNSPDTLPGSLARRLPRGEAGDSLRGASPPPGKAAMLKNPKKVGGFVQKAYICAILRKKAPQAKQQSIN